MVLLYEQVDTIANFKLTDIPAIKDSDLFRDVQTQINRLLKIFGPAVFAGAGALGFGLTVVTINKGILFSSKYGFKKIEKIFTSAKRAVMWSVAIRMALVYYFIGTTTILTKF